MLRPSLAAIGIGICVLAVALDGTALAHEAPTGTPGEWEVQKVDDGITVKRRKWPDYSLLEFVGECTVDAPLARVLAVMSDTDHRSEWSERTVDSRVVEQKGEGDIILYDRTGSPWPVKDRDVVLRVKMTIDAPAREVRVEFDSIEEPSVPPIKDAVRMPYLRGHWLLRASPDDTQTFVEYQVHADPGGAIPDWLANIATRALPMKTLQQLRAQVAKPRYEAMARALAERPVYRTMKR